MNSDTIGTAGLCQSPVPVSSPAITTSTSSTDNTSLGFASDFGDLPFSPGGSAPW